MVKAYAIRAATIKRLQREEPWEFHPHMSIPLSLMQQRGLNHREHYDEINGMMHPRLLRDLGPCRNGTVMVKYPRSPGGSPHERFFKIAMLKVNQQGGEAAYLLWYQHREAHAPLGQVPLVHLVGVTESPLDSSAFRPYLNPTKISTKGITGNINFDANGDVKGAGVTLYQFGDGDWKPLN